MLSEGVLCGGLHSGQIQRNMDMQRGIAAEDIRMRAELHRIAIGFVFCRKSRVKIVRRFFAEEHADIARQAHIHRDGEFIRRHARVCVKVRDLCPRVDAAIRASGAVELNLFARDGADCIVEPPLNGDAVLLKLPADVVCPVILNDQADAAAHSGSFSRRMIAASTSSSRREATRSRAWKCSSRMRVLPSPP
ncbi:hypothetical protein SDC9_142940 [bioreactor metagenome]|uniref:Uncharacterized protein n=1 Tax=bioreactor metagenome TaxID=1076179 RepID=A0A645E2M9_9ZZZZ